ncbi:tRNA pseudouridine(13) synthase TruD [Prosthecobacter sp.]|uniref:tRNA pseudouridine(13) synthase TruD n=1 Tax=Prosthecobacter sp. TaxID=1965333 RepID=UPI002487C263|nr:tRNA pseudouridine(13) synthase TruD [Prosthecobacter sp.]MDI1311888.1 tRNA pseudouridine(13) synthase TruD [Prosthecobacter sp.]
MLNPNDLPYLHGGPLGRARFKVQPEDFVVEELLGFEPSGEGEHCLVWAEKRNLDSNTAAARLADAVGIRRRLVSHCGLKDRHAVTRQWFSLHMPGQASPEPEALESEGLRVLRITRNTRKLRRGIHLGNRFTIRLREPDFDAVLAAQRWQAIAEKGAPNFFGSQRFGNEGRNVEKAQAMFRGEFTPGDRLLRGILLSAARSHLFNAVVAARMARGSWDKPVAGEVFGFADNGTILLPENQRGDEVARFEKGIVELTAPLWGSGELQSVGEVRMLEQELLAEFPDITAGLEAFGLRQERRVMRLRPLDSIFEVMENGDLQIRFDLPKGTYATTLLSELAELDESGPDADAACIQRNEG